MRVALVGERHSANRGEPLLFECTEYLIRQTNEDPVEVICLDFFARSSDVLPDKRRMTVKKKVKKLLLEVTGWDKLHVYREVMNFLKEIKFNMGKKKKRIEQYFETGLSGVDRIIFMGAGTLKYDIRLNFAPYYKIVMECAVKYQIPCFINCAGVESKYDPSDRRCRMFSNVLSNEVFKIITTRDQLAELKKYVKNPNTDVAKIADIGIWSSEVYGIRKEEQSDTIGIGIITPKRFQEFKRDISKEMYEREVIRLLRTLEARGDRWILFNNGDRDDEIFSEYICNQMGKEKKRFVKTPKDPEELVRIISGFKGIITSRLHSCIVAYSLEIPFVAIAWNDKLKYFAQNIGVAERVINGSGFQCEEILLIFEKALTEGYDLAFKRKYQQTNVAYMKQYLDYGK